MRLSVIIPIYNSGLYIKTCLDSLLNQTFTDWQAILIDDGSTDDSGRIIDKYQQLDARFIAVHIENAGVSNARNVGLNMVEGEYFTFLDSDDYIEPDLYSIFFNELRDDEYPIVQCNYVEVFNKQCVVKHGTSQSQTIESFERIIDCIFDETVSSSVCTKVFKTSFFKNERFQCGLTIGEDMLFTINCCEKADLIRVLNYHGYNYVYNDFSAMHKSLSKKRLDSLRVFEILIARYKNNKRILNSLVVGESKELINLINLISLKMEMLDEIKPMSKKLAANYAIVDKKRLGRKNCLICRFVSISPLFYCWLYRLYKSISRLFASVEKSFLL